jgi:DNA-binding transcriptional LysR family regulator
MTFEQIGYFLALAEERSFVRAARRCGISQPSNAVKSLEAELGAPLFERSVTGSKLTAFGIQMHPHLAQIHHDKFQVLELAHTFSCASNPITGVSSRINFRQNGRSKQIASAVS